jgi:chromosome transmission fidelity protein 1
MKLQGFAEKRSLISESGLKHESCLRGVIELIESLVYPDADGRVIISNEEIKYLLLNPSNVFLDVVDQARSIVFAGGTMGSVDDFISQLMPYAERSRICEFRCNHVIPKSNLMPIIIQQSNRKTIKYHFGFENRNNLEMVLCVCFLLVD